MAPGCRRPHSPFLNALPFLPFLLSCGGSPAQPTGAGVTLTILSPADVIRVGGSVDMRLQVVFSDGGTRLITPVWTTDRPAIVQVKPLSSSQQMEAGEWTDIKPGPMDHILFARVTGLAAGDALVIAQSNYGTVTRPVRVTAE